MKATLHHLNTLLCTQLLHDHRHRSPFTSNQFAWHFWSDFTQRTHLPASEGTTRPAASTPTGTMREPSEQLSGIAHHLLHVSNMWSLLSYIAIWSNLVWGRARVWRGRVCAGLGIYLVCVYTCVLVLHWNNLGPTALRHGAPLIIELSIPTYQC